MIATNPLIILGWGIIITSAICFLAALGVVVYTIKKMGDF